MREKTHEYSSVMQAANERENVNHANAGQRGRASRNDNHQAFWHV